MADEVSMYKLQLQQVEAALTADPENAELQKLKHDLQEVIALTQDLRQQQSSKSEGDATAAGPADTEQHQWAVGDKVMAMWSQDKSVEKRHFPAVVEEILEDGTCTVTFDNYDQTEVTKVSLLKPFSESEELDPAAKKKKRDLWAAQREKRKKKAQKKAGRMKQLEEERETEKDKWKSFNAKTFSKTNKGRVKKSIFASPDHATGRVGIGTCGVSGKPMTSTQEFQKYKKHL